jgi:hypothetical protein
MTAIVSIEFADGRTEVWNVRDTRAEFIRQDLLAIDGAPDVESEAQ